MAQELGLADQNVYVHEAMWKVRQTCCFQFVSWWSLPAHVADRCPVSLDQRTVLNRPSQCAFQCRLRISPPVSHVRSVQPIPKHRRVSSGIEGLESELERGKHDEDAA